MTVSGISSFVQTSSFFDQLSYCIQTGQWDRAEPLVAGIRRSADSAPMAYNHTVILNRLERFEEASDVAMKGLEMPALPDVRGLLYLELCRALEECGHCDDFDEAMELDLSSDIKSMFYEMMVSFCLKVKDYDAVNTWIETALAMTDIASHRRQLFFDLKEKIFILHLNDLQIS